MTVNNCIITGYWILDTGYWIWYWDLVLGSGTGVWSWSLVLVLVLGLRLVPRSASKNL